MGRLSQAIPSEHLFVACFEELCSQEGADRVCDFLGITRHKADFSKVESSALPVDMTEDQLMQAREALLPQYEAVEAHFGQLPAQWSDTLEMAI